MYSFSSNYCAKVAGVARATPKPEPGPQWCCQGRGGAGTSPPAQVSTHHSLVCALGSRHSHPELFRATEPSGGGLLSCGFAWPLSPFPHPTPQVCWDTVARREGGRAPLLLLTECSRLAPGTAVCFSTQDRTKISLSHPSLAAVTDITPAMPVFPDPSAVTALKPRHLQLLLL